MWISVAFILALAVSGVNSNGFRSGRRCPPGWEKFEMQCFKFFSDLKPWAEAEKKCLELGGNLASVHDPHTSGFLKTFLRKCASGMPRTWIGAHDAIKNNVWFWSDGSKFDYSDWLTGEPNEYGGKENCVELAYGAEQRWNDLDCATPLNFICLISLPAC
ncbi:ladderlectin-like [Carassius gibelio]|uniref:ladderlectin-like n=1 Tax=Carassius gibelio TaxID=101364 RepID=UPI0022782E35|nr:ladderlectin-like [Carassius gibelio]XP_052438284.1 ladderlectin-like [Carassius gibelio]